jgi:hypothetical protein
VEHVPDGLCATMADCHNLRGRARRQFAAVWANACAGELGVTPRTSLPIALARSTPVSLEGVSTTLGEWLTATDAELMALAGRSQRDRAVKQAYKQIIHVGWNINHGLGIGPTCRDRSHERLAAVPTT